MAYKKNYYLCFLKPLREKLICLLNISKMTSVFSIETIEKKQISQSTFLDYKIVQFVLLKIMYFFWTASDVACRITSNIFPRYFLKNPWTKQGIYDDLSRFFFSGALENIFSLQKLRARTTKQGIYLWVFFFILENIFF